MFSCLSPGTSGFFPAVTNSVAATEHFIVLFGILSQSPQNATAGFLPRNLCCSFSPFHQRLLSCKWFQVCYFWSGSSIFFFSMIFFPSPIYCNSSNFFDLRV